MVEITHFFSISHFLNEAAEVGQIKKNINFERKLKISLVFIKKYSFELQAYSLSGLINPSVTRCPNSYKILNR